jgi:hypothetical protein
MSRSHTVALTIAAMLLAAMAAKLAIDPSASQFALRDVPPEKSTKSADISLADELKLAVAELGPKDGCKTGHPLRITNKHPLKSLELAKFRPVVKRSGHSANIATTIAIESDKILAPRKSYIGCWAIDYDRSRLEKGDLLSFEFEPINAVFR